MYFPFSYVCLKFIVFLSKRKYCRRSLTFQFFHVKSIYTIIQIKINRLKKDFNFLANNKAIFYIIFSDAITFLYCFLYVQHKSNNCVRVYNKYMFLRLQWFILICNFFLVLYNRVNKYTMKYEYYTRGDDYIIIIII